MNAKIVPLMYFNTTLGNHRGTIKYLKSTKKKNVSERLQDEIPTAQKYLKSQNVY